MNDELRKIVQEYRNEGFELSDGEAEKLLWLCNRKMDLNRKIADREEYLPLLFADEVGNYIIRQTVNAITFFGEKEAGVCAAYV